MDKNKSVHKLKGFGPIYYINIDDQPERRQFMESQFEYWDLKDYTRISAYDGRNDDLSHIIKGRYPELVTSGEIGCITSHLRAIHHWYNTSDTPYAIIMEDDCNLDIARYWNFTWADFIARAPYAWDVIQLSIICTGNIVVPIHNRFVNNFSTACYVITRHHARKLIDLHVLEDKYKLDVGVRPRCVADDAIYNSGVTYSCPLLLYNLKLGSNIHPDHIDTFHKSSHDGILDFWSQNGSQITLDQITSYDPYLGRITPPQSELDKS